MRSSTIFASLFCLSAAAAVAQVACSSDDNNPPATNDDAGLVPVVPDAGGFHFNDAEAARTIVIQGAGSVVSSLASAGEGGAQAVSCTSDGTTTSGNCVAEYQETLYANAADGWVFDHWDPGASTVATYYVGQAAPATITAVFTADKIPQPDAAPPPPADGGHDAGTDTGPGTDAGHDTGAPDTGTADADHD